MSYAVGDRVRTTRGPLISGEVLSVETDDRVLVVSWDDGLVTGADTSFLAPVVEFVAPPIPPELCGAIRENPTGERPAWGLCVFLPHAPGTPHSWS